MKTILKFKVKVPTLKIQNAIAQTAKLLNQEIIILDKIKENRKELEEKKGTFCKGYKHLDLSTPQINNFAIQYVQRDIAKKCANHDKCMETLTTSLRIEVIDKTCPSPLFTANDISLQKINMDGLGKVKKEWAAVVKLNTKSENGYLKSELPYCKARDYLIGNKVKVKGYVDVELRSVM